MSESSTPRPPEAAEIAQATPRGIPRSYDDMNTGAMVFELQGTVGELKESIASLTRAVERGFSRIETVERTSGDIKEAIRLLVPKIEDVAGFVKHRAPALADKSDLTTLRSHLCSEIDKRPTRRQTILDIGWIVALVVTAITLGSRFAH